MNFHLDIDCIIGDGRLSILRQPSGKEPFYHFQILAIINNVAMNIFGFVSWHT